MVNDSDKIAAVVVDPKERTDDALGNGADNPLFGMLQNINHKSMHMNHVAF